MSADWFLNMSSGMVHKAKRVGPISEQDLLRRIDNRQNSTETLIQKSQEHVERWVP